MNQGPQHRTPGGSGPFDPSGPRLVDSDQWLGKRMVSRGRIAVVWFLLAATLSAATYRIVDVQATPDPRIFETVSIPLYEMEVPAPRGAVLDRNGRTIALSLPAATVVANPRQIEDPLAVAAALSPILGQPIDEIVPSLEGDRAFRYLVRQADLEVGEQVLALDIEGLRVINEPRREHPNGNCSALAAVGRVNIDHEGMSGLEQNYNDQLVGTPGYIVREQGARGTTIPGGLQETTAAIVGEDLTVTLDRNVQFQAERLLLDAVATAEAQLGVALVAVPSTGEIIAIASVERGSDGFVDCTRHNLAATWTFEPGSVFKPVVVASAINVGAVANDELLMVPGHLTIASHRFEDTPPHGEEVWSPTEILRRSSNIGAIKVAQMIGEPFLYDMVQKFGFGERTDLELKGETKGILPDVRDWNRLTLPNIAIGQGIAVTPLQLLQAFNTIANDGVRVPLNLVTNSEPDPDSEPAEQVRVLDSETAAALMDMLTLAVAEGTGQLAVVDGYTMAGKTGTAWQPCDVGYSCVNHRDEFIGRHYTATFAGIVSNHEGPALTVIVSIDDPGGDIYYGGLVAAPAVAEIASYALRQLRVPSDSESEPGLRRRAEPAPVPVDPETLEAEGELVAAPGVAPIQDPADPTVSATLETPA